jgi:hypothetical protein
MNIHHIQSRPFFRADMCRSQLLSTHLGLRDWAYEIGTHQKVSTAIVSHPNIRAHGFCGQTLSNNQFRDDR